MEKVLSRDAELKSSNSPRKRKTPFQKALDVIDALSKRDRNRLFDTIYKRRIEARRKELARSAAETMAAYERGELFGGTAEEVIKALNDA